MKENEICGKTKEKIILYTLITPPSTFFEHPLFGEEISILYGEILHVLHLLRCSKKAAVEDQL